MIKAFLSVWVLLLFGLAVAMAHALSFDSAQKTKHLHALVALTRFTSPSLSVHYYETSSVLKASPLNPAYPHMPSLDTMDFVYAR